MSLDRNRLFTLLTLPVITAGLSSCGGGSAAGGGSQTPTNPVTTISSKPASLAVGGTATFNFSANIAGSTFQCSVDGGAASSCTSPYTVNQSAGTGGSRSITITATSPGGVVESSPPSYSWTQQNYNTIALYHFDAGTGALVDSSSFTGALNNALTDSSTSNNASGKLSEARTFATATPSSMSVANNASQALASSQMTVEAFVNFTSIPASASVYQVIAGKMGGTGQCGWDFGIIKSGISNYSFYFLGSLDGTTANIVEVDGQIGTSAVLTTGVWHHVAFTWDSSTSTITFFFDGTKIAGSGPVGAAGTPLFTSSDPLRLGATNAANNVAGAYFGVTVNDLNGSLDEFRISQTVRWTANFTPPAGPYSAD